MLPNAHWHPYFAFSIIIGVRKYRFRGSFEGEGLLPSHRNPYGLLNQLFLVGPQHERESARIPTNPYESGPKTSANPSRIRSNNPFESGTDVPSLSQSGCIVSSAQTYFQAILFIRVHNSGQSPSFRRYSVLHIAFIVSFLSLQQW